MNLINRLKKRKSILIILIIVSLISLDFIFSHYDVQEGTFRYESEFDAATGVTTKIGLVPSDYSELANPVSRTVDPGYPQIEYMVRKAIELQGGLDGIIEKGNKVMIKVNLVGANSPSGEGENTDVRVVKALIKIIHEFTEGDVEIIVGEGSARSNDNINDANSVWENSGYRDLLTDTCLSGINFSLLNLNQSINDLIEINLGDKGTSAIQGNSYHVHKAEVEADVYIAVPVLKIHDTGITNALKLQIGTAPGCFYGYNKMAGTQYSPGIYHDVGHRRWTTEAIVDLSNIADVDFVVVDAIMCLETYKTYSGTNQVRFNTIVAGADPVAIDHVCAKLFGLNPDDIAHITLAEKIGLGTNDPDKIKVIGATIEQVMKRVKKNPSENGKFGQSNRTWILSEAFDGTDITVNYIPDEANLRPVAGENGWSQPVYFFDDRIDLLNFYNGSTNIVTYAFTYFDAPEDQVAELWLGSHEAIYVYINNELVYSSTTTNSYSDGEIGDYMKEVNIKQGENSLLVKTLNKFGDYTFAFNICEVENNPLYAGNRVDGLKFHTVHTGTGTPKEYEICPALSLKTSPNPAVNYTRISFELLEAARTVVNISDLSGKVIYTLVDDYLPAGSHEFTWHLNSSQGTRLNHGIYICSVQYGNQIGSTKILIE
jgi:uncharacterized protein (DUF362 family)